MTKIATTPAQRAAMLRDTHWAEGLDAAHLDAIASHSEAHQVADGQVLACQSDDQQWMGVIVAGECEVSQARVGAADRVLRVMGPGRVFGEISLLDGSTRSANLEAVGEVTFLRMDRGGVDALADQHPKAAFALMRQIAAGLATRVRSFEHGGY